MEPCFRRFRVPDVAATEREVAEQQAILAEAIAAQDEAAECSARLKLGFDLTPLDREAEAVVHLERALTLSRRLGDRRTEIEALLHLGTARQYLGEREAAMMLFAEALANARDHDLDEQVHFLLHHRGRCEVEMGRIADARASFEQALALREAIGHSRFIESSRAALREIERR
jgi:tetratricopeptide (TPR) repeat protein